MEKSKEPIRLREKKTPNGLGSLYLDIYLNGKRSYHGESNTSRWQSFRLHLSAKT